MIPRDPLTPRHVVTEDGCTPPGSSGWGYCPSPGKFHHLNGDTCNEIADLRHQGRFWPAYLHPMEDRWVVAGDGFQMENGRVVRWFPLSDPAVIASADDGSRTIAVYPEDMEDCDFDPNCNLQGTAYCDQCPGR